MKRLIPLLLLLCLGWWALWLLASWHEQRQERQAIENARLLREQTLDNLSEEMLGRLEGVAQELLTKQWTLPNRWERKRWAGGQPWVRQLFELDEAGGLLWPVQEDERTQQWLMDGSSEQFLMRTAHLWPLALVGDDDKDVIENSLESSFENALGEEQQVEQTQANLASLPELNPSNSFPNLEQEADIKEEQLKDIPNKQVAQSKDSKQVAQSKIPDAKSQKPEQNKQQIVVGKAEFLPAKKEFPPAQELPLADKAQGNEALSQTEPPVQLNNRSKSPEIVPQAQGVFAGVNQGKTLWHSWVHDDLPSLFLLQKRDERYWGMELNQAMILAEVVLALDAGVRSGSRAVEAQDRFVLLGPTGRILWLRGFFDLNSSRQEPGQKFGERGGGEVAKEGDLEEMLWLAQEEFAQEMAELSLPAPLNALRLQVFPVGETNAQAIKKGSASEVNWLLWGVAFLWLFLLSWIWWSAERPLRQARRHADLLAQAGHQCMTPLQGMWLQSELAQRELASYALEQDGLEGFKLKTRLEKIELEAQRLAGRLRDLQLSSRLQGKLSVQKRELNLSEFLERVVERWQPFFVREERELALQECGSESCVFADEVLLEHVLDNLLENARVHGAGLVQVGLEQNDDQWLVWIEDAGQGIARREYRRVFEPWARLRRGLTEVSGSGLGLAVVRRLARASAWTIKLGRAHLGGLRVEIGIEKVPCQ